MSSSFPSFVPPSDAPLPPSWPMKVSAAAPSPRLTESLGSCHHSRGWAPAAAGSVGAAVASVAAMGLPKAAAGARSGLAEGDGCWPLLSCSIESTPQHYLSPHFPSTKQRL